MVALSEISLLIRSQAFREAKKNFDRRPLIHLANKIGPGMRLLHSRRIEESGQLPRFNDGSSEDAIRGIDRFGADIVEIFMVSHRWLRSSLDLSLSHPDDPDSSKAKALCEFAKWRRSWVQRKHGFKPEIFYWIDFCCFDQADISNSLPMLPLWVACCERTLRYETEDYHSRAWCRLELLLTHKFAFAKHHDVIGAGFVASEGYDGVRESNVLQQPASGRVTNEADAQLIAGLERFALEFEGRYFRKTVFGQTTVKCFKY
jgi:hypothetical protein